MNCERFDGRISCFSTLGQSESWRECEKSCDAKNMKIFSIALFFKNEFECTQRVNTSKVCEVFTCKSYAYDNDSHSILKMLKSWFYECCINFESNWFFDSESLSNQHDRLKQLADCSMIWICQIKKLSVTNVEEVHRYRNSDQKLFVLPLETCTNIEFDYEKSGWTDGDFMEDDEQMEKWKTKFGDFWDNVEGYLPVQPYQPV